VTIKTAPNTLLALWSAADDCWLQVTCPVASESCSGRLWRGAGGSGGGGGGGRGQVEGLRGQWSRVTECSTGMVIIGQTSLSLYHQKASDNISTMQTNISNK